MGSTDKRRGSNKNRTGSKKKAKPAKSKTAKAEKNKIRVKKRLAAKLAQANAPTRTAFERAEMKAAAKRTVGTAVVLAHGAGGSSGHSSMRSWRERFSLLCDEVRIGSDLRWSVLGKSTAWMETPAQWHGH